MPSLPHSKKTYRASCPKVVLRKALLAQRSALAPSEAARLSALIAQRLLLERCWREAHLVALYVAARNEVSTEVLLDAAWNSGKRVLLPRCLPPEQGKGLMEFALCRGRNDLVSGAYGLSEPGPQCPVWPLAGEARYPDLMLVPAVGVSPVGARIGYGKGYYDRLLARPGWKDVPRIGLVYRFQVVSFPADPKDVPLHGYLTEKELQWL